MTEREILADFLFPDIDKTPDYYEKLYPSRDLKEGARVTRFAPSPTGYLHFGNLFTCVASYLTAKNTNGVFFVRVEDTDQKRKVDGAVGAMLRGCRFTASMPMRALLQRTRKSATTVRIIKATGKKFIRRMQRTLLSATWLIPAFAPRRRLSKSATARRARTLRATTANMQNAATSPLSKSKPTLRMVCRGLSALNRPAILAKNAILTI